MGYSNRVELTVIHRWADERIVEYRPYLIRFAAAARVSSASRQQVWLHERSGAWSP
jgi:hypothetical protein